MQTEEIHSFSSLPAPCTEHAAYSITFLKSIPPPSLTLSVDNENGGVCSQMIVMPAVIRNGFGKEKIMVKLSMTMNYWDNWCIRLSWNHQCLLRKESRWTSQSLSSLQAGISKGLKKSGVLIPSKIKQDFKPFLYHQSNLKPSQNLKSEIDIFSDLYKKSEVCSEVVVVSPRK